MTSPENNRLLAKWDSKIAESFTPRWSLTKHTPIAITDMTGAIPHRNGLTKGGDIYKNLAGTPVTVISAKKPSEPEGEFIMVGPNLMAEEVNALMYFTAPNKRFGFDTQDIINDWTALYENPIHSQRKATHAAMPGWTQYEASRDLILGILKRNFKTQTFREEDKADTITPVLRWRKASDGKLQIILKPLEDDLRYALAEFLPEQIKDATRLDSGMGLMYVGAYSPNNTEWKSKDGYISGDKRTQMIGSTQVLAYAYRKVAEQQSGRPTEPNEDLQESPLLTGLSEYAISGTVPAIELTDTTPDNSIVDLYNTEIFGNSDLSSKETTTHDPLNIIEKILSKSHKKNPHFINKETLINKDTELINEESEAI